MYLEFMQALSKTLTADEQFYLKEQFVLLEPNKSGTISLENIKLVSFISESLEFLSLLQHWSQLQIFIISGLDEEFNRCYEGFSDPRFLGIGMF